MSAAAALLVLLGTTVALSGSDDAPARVVGAVPAAHQPTRTAASFVDSVGVAVHWDYGNTPYRQEYRRVRARLVDSGIRHVRGEASRAADLHRRGIATTVTVDKDLDGPRARRGASTEGDDPVSKLAAITPLVASGAVVAVEGPNEPDIFWVERGLEYEGEPYPVGPLRWQEDLYRAVKGDEATSHLTVIGPSLGRTYWGGGHPYNPGELADVADWGNFHPYPGGNTFTPPRRYAGVERYFWDSDHPSVALDEHPIQLDTYRPAFGDLPMAATETGYSTWRLGQSERMQGRYLPRLFLENYRLGLRRTYGYELVDEFPDPSGRNREAHFGLLRHDLTPKPAYRALRSLLGVVGTSGWEAGEGRKASEGRKAGKGGEAAMGGEGGEAPEPLDYELAVSPPTGYSARALHHVVLARPDGSHVVALWHEVSGDDISGLREDPPEPILEVSQPPMRVSLDLGARAAGAQVQVLDDEGRLEPARVRARGTVRDFDVPDRVTLVTVPPMG